MAVRHPGFLLTALLTVLPVALPAAPYLVKDLDTAPSAEPGQVSPAGLGSRQGVSYFAAGDPAHGIELWRSDGTPGGTERLTDICSGRCSSQPAAISVRAGQIFFQANDGFSGDELWVSDGTPGSERRVRDACPGPCSAAPGRVEAVGERLLFVAHLPASAEPDRFELWQTDGTRGGTARVKAICSAPCTVASDLIPIGSTPGSGKALFIVKPQPWESELWVTDGTAAGTRSFREFGNEINLREVSPPVLPGDGFAWAWAADGLWRTDGTAAGTFRLKRTDELATEPSSYIELAFLWHGVYVGFLVSGEIIRSDGTPEGTFRIARIPEGSYVSDFALLDGEILLQLQSDVPVLWSTRGTADTTGPLDLGLDPETGAPYFLTSLGGDRVVFLRISANDPDRAAQLWVTDGTAAGTRQLAAPAGYATDSLTGEAFFPTGDGRAFFFREPVTGDHPDHLWITDGTAAGTHLVRSFGDAPGSSGPQEQAALGRTLIFSALAPNASLPLLFATDGTAAGTRLLSEDAVSASSFFRFGDQLLFSAGKYDPIYDATWVTDGTPDGTTRVKKAAFTHPARLGGQILFSGYTPAFGTELWKISSLTQPVDLVKNIDPFYDDLNPSSGQTCVAESSFPVPGAVVGGRLLLAADDGRSGRELWASDGTRAGTVLLRDINPGRTPDFPEPCDFGPFGPPRHDAGLSSDPRDFVLLGSVALFTADDGSRGRELWITNGTFLGTHRVADLLPGPRGSEPHDLVRFQNRVYFLAGNPGGPGQGESLWRTDGTLLGTTRVRDLATNGLPSWGRGFTVAAGRLFFSVYNETTGAELWTSTGDFNGTGLVTDLNPGPASSSAQSLTAIGASLLFAADDGLTGLEPWRTDGTAAGTVRVDDIAPGRDASSPGPFTAIQNLVITGADDGVHGREPWAIPRAEIVRPPR